MTLIIKDRVKDTSTTTGTGNLTVSGTAPTGFRTFDDAMSASDTSVIAIKHQSADEWEICETTYSGSNVLTRGTLLASSTGSRIDFSAGTKDVWIDLAADKAVDTDRTQTLTNKTLTSPVISEISNTGALTLPTATDTLVGRATTDTLTNKTLDSNDNDFLNRPMVNVARYGVTGDGTTNDSTALNLALSSVPAGTSLYIPSGFDCFVSSQVVFTVANTRLVGYGAKISRGSTYSDSYVVKFGAINCTLEGIEVDGNEVTSTVFGAGGSGTTADGMAIRRCHIHHSAYCVSAVSCRDVLLEYNKFDHCRENAGLVRIHDITSTRALLNNQVLFNVFDCTDHTASTTTAPCLLVRGDETNRMLWCKVIGNTFYHVSSPSNSAALCCEMRFNTGSLFEGNVSSNGAMLVSVAGSSACAVVGNVCDGCAFYAIEMAPTSSSGNQDNVISGNVIYGRNRCSYAIALQGTVNSYGCTINGNSIESCRLYGIFVTSGWREVAIVGNRVRFTTDVSDQRAIYIASSVGSGLSNIHFSITSNVLNGNSMAEYGIYAPTLDDSAVFGNVGGNFLTAFCSINGSTTTPSAASNMNIT